MCNNCLGRELVRGSKVEPAASAWLAAPALGHVTKTFPSAANNYPGLLFVPFYLRLWAGGDKERRNVKGNESKIVKKGFAWAWFGLTGVVQAEVSVSRSHISLLGKIQVPPKSAVAFRLCFNRALKQVPNFKQLIYSIHCKLSVPAGDAECR